MSRPQSAKRPQSGKLRRQVGDAVSYEDLLVAQYLEELRKTPQNGTKRFVQLNTDVEHFKKEDIK